MKINCNHKSSASDGKRSLEGVKFLPATLQKVTGDAGDEEGGMRVMRKMRTWTANAYANPM